MNKNESIIANPMMCDPVTGVCEIPAQPSSQAAAFEPANPARPAKPLRILYFTDPICSTCWGIEPQLRRLKLEYGDYIDIDYRMGGLLRSWDTYGGKDVSGPASVAQHWDEVGAHYDMPIDGDVWLEDPLTSSYPPSIAFKAAQIQDGTKAIHFLRRIREMVFLGKKNITRWEHLAQAAVDSGLDVAKFSADYDGAARERFNEDLMLARNLGVRGFPTLFFSDDNGNRLTVYGFRPYEAFEQALLSLYPSAVRAVVDASPESLFAHYPTLTTTEFAMLSESGKEEAERSLAKLAQAGGIERQQYAKGFIWSRKTHISDQSAGS